MPATVFRTALAALVALLLTAAPAFADALDDARAAGYLGERTDGFVQAMSGAPGSAKALAQDINAKRKAYYDQIAAKSGTTADKVGMLAGAKTIAKVPNGTYVQDAGGAWRRK